MKKYEYRVLVVKDLDEIVLNNLGKDGWELVSVVWNGSYRNFYLKKEIPVIKDRFATGPL